MENIILTVENGSEYEYVINDKGVKLAFKEYDKEAVIFFPERALNKVVRTAKALYQQLELQEAELKASRESEKAHFEEQQKIIKDCFVKIGKLSRYKGEFMGTLEGLLFWDLPEDLKVKIQTQLKYLKEKELSDF